MVEGAQRAAKLSFWARIVRAQLRQGLAPNILFVSGRARRSLLSLVLLLALGQFAWARRLHFPLLGVDLSPPKGFQVRQAGSSRVNFAHPTNKAVLSIYRVEFGNLVNFTPEMEAQMLAHLRKRLGPQASLEWSETSLGGRPARRIRASGMRAKAPWGLLAAWQIRGGQAVVLELLYPLPLQGEMESLFSGLCLDLSWISPERG